MNPQFDFFRNGVVEQLQRLPGFRSRSMFGGCGLYSRDRFFGLIYKRRLYFRTGDETRAAYTTAGMSFFRPNPKQSLKNYYEVPTGILQDHDALVRWAKAAIKRSTKT